MIMGDRTAVGLPHILVPANEEPGLIEFAAKFAKAHNAALMTLYVQPRPEPGSGRSACVRKEGIATNRDLLAQMAFQAARTICESVGVPVLQIYALHNSPGEMLVDHAATWGVDAVIMGATRKVEPLPVLAGPVLQKVYSDLPPSIPLIIRT